MIVKAGADRDRQVERLPDGLGCPAGRPRDQRGRGPASPRDPGVARTAPRIVTVMPLKPLHDAGRLTRVIATSFQSVSGAGVNGIAELREQACVAKGEALTPGTSAHRSLQPHPAIDRFGPDGYTGEEMKLVNETRRSSTRRRSALRRQRCGSRSSPRTRSRSTAETEVKITAARARDLFERFPGLSSGTTRPSSATRCRSWSRGRTTASWPDPRGPL